MRVITIKGFRIRLDVEQKRFTGSPEEVKKLKRELKRRGLSARPADYL